MSYSSKLITLRTLILQLRAVADTIGYNPGITVTDYLQLSDVLDKVVELKKVVDEKNLVLEITEDEEGAYVGYNLVLADRTYGSALDISAWDLTPSWPHRKPTSESANEGLDGVPMSPGLTA